MERIEIRQKLNDIFALTVKGTQNVADIDENSNLVTDLGLNSVGLLYTVIAIEEFFNMRFDDISLGDLQTVKDVIDYIQSKVD